MPAYIRLIIMIGEIIGLGIVSIVFMRKAIKEAKAEQELKVNFRYVITAFDTWLIIILNIINICIFVFSSYNLQFCSYQKLVLVSLFTIFSILFIIISMYQEPHKIHFSIFIISFLVDILVLCGFIASLIEPVEWIHIKKVINEENTEELIYPMKFIGYNKDDDTYVFFYKDDRGNHFEDDCKAKVILISDSEDSYLEKYTKTKTFLNEERKHSSDDYITEEKETSYVLYLNEKQLIELTD